MTGAKRPGDLPVHARERLADMRAHQLFTSDLSVSEFVLVREAGFDPVGLVMGTSIYQIAPKIPSLSHGEPGRELVDTTRALYHARELAMNRMEEEAEALGADGIVGVRLTVNLSTDPTRVAWQQYRRWSAWSKQLGFRRPQAAPTAGYFTGWAELAGAQWQQWCQQMGWAQIPLPPWAQPTGRASYALGPNTAEFIAIGTAVRHRTGEHYRNKHGKPFQSDLSGQDFWLLIRTGFRPVGFVKLAMARLQDDLFREFPRRHPDAPTGIVGMTVSEATYGGQAASGPPIVEFTALGTAIAPLAPSDPRRKAPPPKPRLVVPLDR
jgi:uncharacterized protein YbjQ (UPF0145 family)